MKFNKLRNSKETHHLKSISIKLIEPDYNLIKLDVIRCDLILI